MCKGGRQNTVSGERCPSGGSQVTGFRLRGTNRARCPWEELNSSTGRGRESSHAEDPEFVCCRSVAETESSPGRESAHREQS